MSELLFNLPDAIPWKYERSEPGVDTKSIVDHRFGLVQSMIDDAKSDFASALTEMRSKLTPITVGTVALSGIDIEALNVDVPDFTLAFNKVFNTTLPEFTVTYVEPGGKPSDVIPTWEDGTFVLTTEMVDKLAQWLLGNESAIPAALFNTIYTAATTQLSEDVTARKLVLVAEAAARGWTCPAEIESARLTQLEREYSKGAAEISAKIAERNMELTQANFHKAVEVAAQYIQIQMDYNIKKNAAKIEFYSAAVDVWIKQVEAEIKRISAEVTAFQGKVEGFKASAMVYKTEADVYDANVRAYATGVEAIKTKLSVIVESIKAEVMKYEADARTAIDNEKLKVQAQIANNELGQRIAEADANFHAQLMASGMGALHVQAGVSASHNTGEQVGFSYSYGENYAEQQSRSENMSITREVE